MVTTSRLGTVTWSKPTYYVNYDNDTGIVKSIGPALEEFSSTKISVELALKIINSGNMLSNYRIVKKGNSYDIEQVMDQHVVDITHLVKVTNAQNSNIKVVRNLKDQTWIVNKSVDEPLFIFVCKSTSSRHYIRTLTVTETVQEIPFIFDSESDDIVLYSKSKFSNMEIIYE